MNYTSSDPTDGIYTPSSLEMDPDEAKKLFKLYGILVLLDVPVGTEIGIDFHCWSVAEKFKGIKFIPPGLHFIYYSAKSLAYNQTSPRCGYFWWVQHFQIVTKQWSKEDELFYDPEVQQQERIKLGIRDLDPFLGTYPLNEHKKWLTLTKFISEHQAKRLSPENGLVNSVQSVIENPTNCDLPNQRFCSKIVDERSILRFTAIQNRKFPVGSSADDITKCSMDSSWLLTSLLEKEFQNDHFKLLGEYQFAFICFLIGHCFDAFEQWKRLTHLLCCSRNALVYFQDLYYNYLDVLYWQLKELPRDFYVDAISCENFLTASLNELYENVNEAENLRADVKERLKRLHRFIIKRFNWDISVGLQENEPLVLES